MVVHIIKMSVGLVIHHCNLYVWPSKDEDLQKTLNVNVTFSLKSLNSLWHNYARKLLNLIKINPFACRITEYYTHIGASEHFAISNPNRSITYQVAQFYKTNKNNTNNNNNDNNNNNNGATAT